MECSVHDLHFEQQPFHIKRQHHPTPTAASRQQPMVVNTRNREHPTAVLEPEGSEHSGHSGKIWTCVGE
jgi:hypothetical protein